MVSLINSIVAADWVMPIKDADDSIKPELHPDSTIFGRRNDTTSFSNKNYSKISKLDSEYSHIAVRLGHPNRSELNAVKKDNVVRVMKHYKSYYSRSFVRNICKSTFLLSSNNKKSYITHIKNCFCERAKELNIDVSDLESEFEIVLQESFSGFWARNFGFVKKRNIKYLESIMDEFLTRIENKEAEIRNKLFNKPFSDEQVNTAFDNINKAPFPLYIDNEDYNKFLMCLNSTNLGDEGIPFNGKVDHLSRQMSETCVMHASINALMQNKKGRHLVNRLFKLDEKGNALKTCLPEAIKSGYNDANIHDARSAVFLSIRSSFGDGDLAALILNSIFYSMINQTGMDYIFRGFEALSGERAQIYFPDEAIPDGVGLVNAHQGDLLTFYKNLEIMLDEGAGAIICSVSGEDMGNYITDLETETKTKKRVFSSNQHAYSIVKMTDDYVYMQESNEPKLFIKLGKYQFLRNLHDVSTWKYD